MLQVVLLTIGLPDVFAVQGTLPPVWLQLLTCCARSNQHSGGICGQLALEQLTALQIGESRTPAPHDCARCSEADIFQ